MGFPQSFRPARRFLKELFSSVEKEGPRVDLDHRRSIIQKRIYDDDIECAAVDRSGAAGGDLSDDGWNEAGPAARRDGGTDPTAGTLLAIPRRGRGAWCGWPDSSRPPAGLPRPDSARRRRAGYHHD